MIYRFKLFHIGLGAPLAPRPPAATLPEFPRGTRFRLRPMGLCFNRIFSLLRPQPHSRSPRFLAAPSHSPLCGCLKWPRSGSPLSLLLASRSRGQDRLSLKTDGFTLIELLVVMVIIGLLAALVAPRFVRQEEKAKMKAARAQIELLGTALDTFRLDVGRYPTTQEGLEALRQQPGGLPKWDGPYLKKGVPLDPWGKPYSYESPGRHGPYDLLSYGADGAQGGEGDNRDITSWEG